jgi:hypothetical protein
MPGAASPAAPGAARRKNTAVHGLALPCAQCSAPGNAFSHSGISPTLSQAAPLKRDVPLRVRMQTAHEGTPLCLSQARDSQPP